MGPADIVALLAAVRPRQGQKPPTYSSGDAADWITFRRTWELVAEANHWDDDTKVMQLGAAIEGQAARISADIDPRFDPTGLPWLPNALMQAYEGRFLPAAASCLSLAHFTEARQGASESALLWAGRLRELFTRARPGTDVETSGECITKFIMALHNSKVKTAVFDAAPATLTAASEAAANKEASLAILHGTFKGSHLHTMSAAGGSNTSSSDEDGEDAAIVAARRKVRCYNCDKLGHYKRDCPKLSKKKRAPVVSRLPVAPRRKLPRRGPESPSPSPLRTPMPWPPSSRSCSRTPPPLGCSPASWLVLLPWGVRETESAGLDGPASRSVLLSLSPVRACLLCFLPRRPPAPAGYDAGRGHQSLL